MRDSIFKREQKYSFRVLNVPRQCPLVLLEEVRLRQGKAVKGKVVPVLN
jgi:hypothetical protein